VLVSLSTHVPLTTTRSTTSSSTTSTTSSSTTTQSATLTDAAPSQISNNNGVKTALSWSISACAIFLSAVFVL
jgi:hypothetical protein